MRSARQHRDRVAHVGLERWRMPPIAVVVLTMAAAVLVGGA